MIIKALWRNKDIREHFFSMLLIIGCLCAFWVMLFYGICAEVERRSDIPRAAKMKWAHERGLNQWETEQRQPELIKAMQEVKNGR